MSMPPVTGKSSLLYFIDRLEKAHPAPFDEHILLVHECCMNEEGIEAVKKVMRHPFIALCPCSNIFIHNALPPVELMRSSGIKLTVGTDSLSSNDDLDMVKEMFCLQENFPDIPFGELVVWASKMARSSWARRMNWDRSRRACVQALFILTIFRRTAGLLLQVPLEE